MVLTHTQISSRGGKARARNLTPERLSEIARIGSDAARAAQGSCKHEDGSKRSRSGKRWRYFCRQCGVMVAAPRTEKAGEASK